MHGWFWSEGELFASCGQFYWRERGWYYVPQIFTSICTTA
jgi:hypothetical protein